MTFDNQLLSSIYAEYNNDYLTWEQLPKYELSSDQSSNFLSNIIIGDYNLDSISEIKKGFVHEIVYFLDKLAENNCLNLPNKKRIYMFEEAILKSINFWMSFCNNQNIESTLQSLNIIDNRFTNIRYINKIYYLHLKKDISGLSKLNKELTTNLETLSIFNSKEINLLNNIFRSNDLIFPMTKYIKSSTTFNNLLLELDKNFKVEGYKDIIYLQLFQTSTYYFYAGEYKSSLALLSYLIQIDSKNKDYYNYKKLSFLSELNLNKDILELVKNFNSINTKFNFFRNYMFISSSIKLGSNMSELVNFFNDINHESNWMHLELAFILAMEMYRTNDDKAALDFINKCCLNNLENSDDPIHLFKYGILLERNNEIKKAEDIIQRSIDISDSSYPFVLNYLAYLWVENDRKLDLAEDMLKKAVKDSDYNNGAIIDSLGWLYYKKNDLNLAEKWIYNAYLLEPSEPEIIDHLSQIYFQLGRYKEAKFLDNKILLFHRDYFKFDEVLNRNE